MNSRNPKLREVVDLIFNCGIVIEYNFETVFGPYESSTEEWEEMLKQYGDKEIAEISYESTRDELDCLRFIVK